MRTLFGLLFTCRAKREEGIGYEALHQMVWRQIR